jgi:hypothetical protein
MPPAPAPAHLPLAPAPAPAAVYLAPAPAQAEAAVQGEELAEGLAGPTGVLDAYSQGTSVGIAPIVLNLLRSRSAEAGPGSRHSSLVHSCADDVCPLPGHSRHVSLHLRSCCRRGRLGATHPGGDYSKTTDLPGSNCSSAHHRVKMSRQRQPSRSHSRQR